MTRIVKTLGAWSAWVLLAGLGPPAAAGQDAGWQAGAARVDTTPSTPVRMAGYASRTGPSQGVAHPLAAKALALADARGHKVVVGVDTRDAAGRPSGKKVPLGPDEFRRSLYLQMRRSLPLSLLEVFDAPAMTPNCPLRASSTAAPQALMLMNNEFVVQQAAAFAERVGREAGADPAAQVRRAWRLALAVEPTPDQVAAAETFLRAQQEELTADGTAAGARPAAGAPDPALRALAGFCQALLSSNAFLYVD